jgi:hypothetical protein
VPGFKLIKPHTTVAYSLVLEGHPLILREGAGAKQSLMNRLIALARHLRNSPIQRDTQHAGRNEVQISAPKN